MEILNRSVAIVKPRRPYLAWAKTHDAEGLAQSVFENMHREPHIFLLPEYTDPGSQLLGRASGSLLSKPK